MITLKKAIDACNILNEANEKISMLLGAPVELQMIQPFIPGLYIKNDVAKKVDLDLLKETIIDVVCDHFMISPSGLIAKVRVRGSVDARKEVAFLLNKYVEDITDKEIGEILNIDRSTATVSRQSAEDLIANNKAFKFNHIRILQQLKERINLHD